MNEFDVNFDDLLAQIDEAEPIAPQGGDLPSGRYLFRIDRIQDKELYVPQKFADADDATKAKAAMPRVRVMYRAINKETGLPFGSPVFGDWYVGASLAKAEQDFADGNLGKSNARDAMELFAYRRKMSLGMLNNFRKVIGVSDGPTGVGLDGVFARLNVDEWPGRQFVGQYRAGDERGEITAYYAVDDPKNGISRVK